MWVKKLGQSHLAGKSSETLCGTPMLGNNYADVIPEHKQKKCGDCYSIEPGSDDYLNVFMDTISDDEDKLVADLNEHSIHDLSLLHKCSKTKLMHAVLVLNKTRNKLLDDYSSLLDSLASTYNE